MEDIRNMDNKADKHLTVYVELLYRIVLQMQVTLSSQ